MDTHSPPGGDVDRGTAFIVLAVVLFSISLTTTIIRVYMRVLQHQLGWDDFTIALATLLELIELVFNGLEYHAGDGHHVFYLKASQVVKIVKWNYVTEFFLFFIICLTKISICLFILRIKNTGWLKWFLYALMAGLVVTTLVCEVILFAQCRPIRTWWDRSAGTCWDLTIYNGSIWAQIGRFDVRAESQRFLIVVRLFYLFRSGLFFPPRRGSLEHTDIPTPQGRSVWSDEYRSAVCITLPSWRLNIDTLKSATACAAVRASLARNKTSNDLTCKCSSIRPLNYES